MALPFPTAGIATVRVPRRATPAIHTLLKKKSSYNRNISIRKCSTRRGGWRGVGRCGTSEWSEGNAMLEEEVFQFMEVSEKPNHFPTKQELLDAGRSDLVSKILTQGGWLAAGWDHHDAETLHASSDYGAADEQDDYNGDALPALDSASIIDVSAEDVSNKPEKNTSEGSGIAAILNGLERERTLFYSEASEAKKGNRHQQFSEDKEYGNALQSRQPLSVNGKRRADDRNLNIKEGQDIFHDHGRETAEAGYKNKEIDSGKKIVEPERWDIPSMRQMEELESETKGMPGVSGTFWQRQRRVGKHISSQTMHVDESRRVVVDKIDEIIEKGQEWMWNVKRSSSGQSQRIYPSGVPNTIMSRIQKLESQLVSTLGSLKSGKDVMELKKNDDKSALEELEKASDALEFRETEIMKMRAKLRTTRAKLTALEGTMAMEIIYLCFL
ncbi:protein PTST homolog 2, chloroplastic isoform X2 [Cryptomeria japonica]|uniref:protein PTST homolog 2, chloroplastic isoform X2 n=1 Tax=Cryptomeria japonica TaxID=3369 RepID=UPI0027DA557C|nr:protein PTST homolog 2, chloroplastic isoform X2 [Cryptomeria japonica]